MLAVNKSRKQSRSLILYMQRRFKKKEKVPQITNIARAQEYFDRAYPPVYGPRWPSIRLALLSKQKYVAAVNNFANHENTIEKFQELGAVDIGHKCTMIAAQMRANKKEWDQQISQEHDEDTFQDHPEIEESKLIRPSLIELDDDELAAQAKAESIKRYPEEYRARALAKDYNPGTMELDHTSRIILPSEVESRGVNVMMDYVPATKLKPKMDHQMKVMDYYALDGASLLPVLALDLQPGDRVLDLCAAPGGKTLIALQSLLPGLVVSNDMFESRINRLHRVLKQYIPPGFSDLDRISLVTTGDGCVIREREAYDKVLVDAPCLTDRFSLKENDNSIFKSSRTKERLKLPELQSQLLVSALKAVRPGGTVVYSTCSLSPLQNDGVVHLALSKIWKSTRIEYCVVDMSYAVRPLNFLYRFGSNLGLRYGQIVLPSLLSNFGPMYCSKIKRLR
ncbi:5-methylcytosine rRNA methyltransferase NSUN4 isoform X2 [Procambarus clarkii]|uniref:5-methylcytosine rRNA methyltransferase NSUN4 isoform X2 n=1 Tax=Procambarus clarkii TaxID=6728 RepID=UPI001E678097|nr:5-methylcytosine rRNA methyltransferase NSUN4-like isoform X2 [Procambarus clarkii]